MKYLLLKIFDKSCNLISQFSWEHALPMEGDLIKFEDNCGDDITCKITQIIFDLSDSSILIKTDYEKN